MLRREELFLFLDRLYRLYLEDMGAEMDAVSKMKEFWSYAGEQFQDRLRLIRKIMQSRSRAEYESAVMILKQS